MGGRRQVVEGTHLRTIEAKIKNDGPRRTNQSFAETHGPKRKTNPWTNKLMVRMTKTKKLSETLTAKKTQTKHKCPLRVSSFVI